MGEVDVVHVVSPSSRDRDFVFHCQRHRVGRLEVWIDGLSAEAAGSIAGFPFGLDELWCCVAFEFGLCAAGRGLAYLIWIVGTPSPPLFSFAFRVCRAPLSAICATIFEYARLIVFVVRAGLALDFLSIGLAVCAVALVDVFYAGFIALAGLLAYALLVCFIVCAVAFADGGRVFSAIFIVAVESLFAVCVFIVLWCAIFTSGGVGCEFCSAPCARLGFVVCYVALLDRSPVHVEDSLPVEDASRSCDDVREVRCTV